MQSRTKQTHTIKDINQRIKLQAARRYYGKMASTTQDDTRFDKDDSDSDQLIITPSNYLT